LSQITIYYSLITNYPTQPLYYFFGKDAIKPMTHKGAVVITGASTGIGEACALYLDQHGFQVFAGVRKSADGEALRAKASANLTPLFIDVTDPAQIAAAVQTVAKAVASAGLGGLINNAGIALGGPLEFLPLSELRRQFEINVIGQVAVTQAFLPLLRQGQGRVVNMSSISGRVALPFFGPYSASKFALEALNDALRLELKPWGIEVICIEPGSVATPIWDKSLNKGDEIADNLPPASEELYGRKLAALRKAVVKTGQRGIPPEKVAAAVHQALTASRPKIRYVVGLDAKLGALIVKLLPDRLRDWLVMTSA
jgi:NAD(P)-dependent dehydrogenase (short-subunit alcohol dehydrogenase family)